MRPLLLLLAGAFVSALIGAATADQPDSTAIFTFAGLFVLTFVYLGFTDYAATRRWPLLGSLPGAVPRPRLSVSRPIVRADVAITGTLPDRTEYGVRAEFVNLPVTNDPHAVIAAENVQAWIDFKAADGTPIASGQQARWTHVRQDLGPLDPLDDPELNETRITAGATRHLDVAAYCEPFGGFIIWTNESTRAASSPQYALGPHEVVATVTIRSSNAPDLSVTLRLVKQADGVTVTPEP